MPSTDACYMASKHLGLIHLNEGVPIICQLCYLKQPPLPENMPWGQETPRTPRISSPEDRKRHAPPGFLAQGTGNATQPQDF